MNFQKVHIIGGRFLDPRLTYNGDTQSKRNLDLTEDLVLNPWKLNIDLQKRVIRVKGPNTAIYPLMDGLLLLFKEKTPSNRDFYFSKFYDEKSLAMLKKYGIDDVIAENPNQIYDFRGDTIICSDGKVITTEKGTQITNASYVLEYVKLLNNDTNKTDVKTSDSCFLKNKPEGFKCFLHTMDGSVTVENALLGNLNGRN